MSLDLRKYRGIATSLAVVGIASKSYSLIDRVANALSSDSVSRAIYENCRILENLLRRNLDTEGEEGIHEERYKKDGKELTQVKIILKDEPPSSINGYLADDEQVKNFLEDTSRDIRIARGVASYAMSMIAATLSKRVASRKEEKEGEV